MDARPRWVTVLVAGAVVALAVAAGWWAGRVTLAPAAAPTAQARETVWADVVEASVGRSLPYSTSLKQPSVPVAYNGVSGVVTKAESGAVGVGDVLYQVGDVPVRAVQAQQPMWRDLALKAEGDDVRAIQELLIKLGHFKGEASGTFGAGTEAAVKAWQKAERRAQTGTVPRGEVIAFRKLPVQMTLGEELTVGKVLAGGEEAVLAPTGEREFMLVLSEEQARQVPAEATVEVTYEEHVWPAVVVETRQDEHSAYQLVLAGPDGGEVCAEACDVLPLDPSLTLRSKVIVVPQVSGAAVPAAAVRTAGDGRTYVETKSGEVPVKVLGSGQGLAIVEGVAVGATVKVGEAASRPEQSAPVTAPSPSESGG